MTRQAIPPGTLKRGHLVLVEFPPAEKNLTPTREGQTSYTELAGPHPALVVSDTSSSRYNHLLVVPFTTERTFVADWVKSRPDLYLRFPAGTGKSSMVSDGDGLSVDSVMLWDQFRAVDPDRVQRIVGKLSGPTLVRALSPLWDANGPLQGLVHDLLKQQAAKLSPKK